MLENSPLPGTNMGTRYCFSCCGFSQLYSSTPAQDMRSSFGSSSASGMPVICAICFSVFGLRMPPNLSAISASSSEIISASAQYSGSVRSIFLMPSFCGMRSVIILPSFAMGSRNGPSITSGG